MKIPSLVLKQLYTFGSLENTADGVKFSLKNRLSDAILTGMNTVSIDGSQVELKEVELRTGGDERHSVGSCDVRQPAPVSSRQGD